MFRKLLDWQWISIILGVIVLGLMILLSYRMSQMNADMSEMHKQRLELLHINKDLNKQIILLRTTGQIQKQIIKNQHETLERQQDLLQRYKNTLQWLRDNFLPQPDPPYDPDKIA